MNTNNCIKNLLRLICLLQKNSENKHCLEDGCIKPFLGPTINSICYNTRVITLYNKNGNIFTANYTSDDSSTNSSSFFRVDNVSDDCATLLILRKENDTFLSTKQTIKISLKCICAIKCIEDVVISNL